MWGDVGEYCGENVPIELTATIGVTEAAKLGKAGHCVRGFESAPFANLRRERSSDNLIGNRYLEMMVAVNADNLLVALLPEAISGGNLNFLPNLATWAFHRHDNILFGFHFVPVQLYRPLLLLSLGSKLLELGSIPLAENRD